MSIIVLIIIFLLSKKEITKLSHKNVIFIFKNFFLTLITLKLTSFLSLSFKSYYTN